MRRGFIGLQALIQNVEYTVNFKKPRFMLALVSNFIKSFLKEISPLRGVDIAITYDCNLKCEHCNVELLKDKQYSKFLLIIFGDGPEFGFLKHLCEKIKMTNNIKFMGFKPHEDIIKELQNSIALLVASSKDNLLLNILRCVNNIELENIIYVLVKIRYERITCVRTKNENLCDNSNV